MKGKVVEACQLGTSESDGIDKMQTHSSCNSKGINGFESAHGTYCNVVE